jgi:hypothetical protein
VGSSRFSYHGSAGWLGGVRLRIVIPANFVFLGSALSLGGAALYVRDTWRGETAPNRVTWSLWALEPILAYVLERQANVGLAAVWTLVLGCVPLVVLAASFHDPKSVWKVGRFDLVCGALSIVGMMVWALSGEQTIALVSFVTADAIAALPTLRKSFREPHTETAWNFIASAVAAVITLLTLSRFTTAGALFPMSVLVMNTTISTLVLTKVGVVSSPQANGTKAVSA